MATEDELLEKRIQALSGMAGSAGWDPGVVEGLAEITRMSAQRKKLEAQNKMVDSVEQRLELERAMRNEGLGSYKDQGDKPWSPESDHIFQRQVYLDERKSAKELEMSKRSIETLEGMYTQLEKTGMTRMSPGDIWGAVSGWWGSKTQYGSTAAVYEDTRQALITNIARALGEKGNIPEVAIANRMVNILPKMSDTAPVAKKKFDNLKYALGLIDVNPTLTLNYLDNIDPKTGELRGDSKESTNSLGADPNKALEREKDIKILQGLDYNMDQINEFFGEEL